MLIPIGGGYADTFRTVIEAALERANNTVNIVMLPVAFSTSAQSITDEERALNMGDAERRRAQLEAACKSAMPDDIACTITLAPVFTRADAENPDMLELFDDDLTAVFFLGGDQAVAMKIIAGTALETTLEQAYERGVIIAGTSAGAGLQSQAMLAGYAGDTNADTSLRPGAVEIWNGQTQRGLSFGIENAIIDQHFFERGRVGRLLNAISQHNLPAVGIGLDSYTGVHILNNTRLERPFGLYTVAVLDAETFSAGANAVYTDDVLSLRNVLFHLLAPGDFAYDLETRTASIAELPSRLNRDFEALTLPDGAGALILSDNITASPDNPILRRFVDLAGGIQGDRSILIVVDGYSDESAANDAFLNFASNLPGEVEQAVNWNIVSGAALPDDYAVTAFDGIILLGADQSALHPEVLAPIREAWLAGVPLLANDAAVALIGSFYTAHSPNPRQAADEALYEQAVQGAFIEGNLTIQPGLGLLNVMIEPHILGNNRFGRLVALAYTHPDVLAIGLNQRTAVEITRAGASVMIGQSGVFVLDLRAAQLALGDNNAFVFANALLDVFAPGENMEPADAN